MQAYGLYSHIQANLWRSAFLLAGFVVLLQALLMSAQIIYAALAFGGELDEIITIARERFITTWPLAMLAALAWFAVAYLFHGAMIARATGAHGITREEAPTLYNALENLCISRGITMPKLQVIETPALNAYAAGLSEGDTVVAVTRGLVDTLAPDEIEAVLAHELTHIRNKDAQLMVVAIIFAGIFAFIPDLFIRRWDFPYDVWPRERRRQDPYGQSTLDDDAARETEGSGWRMRRTGGGSGRSGGGGSGGGGAIVVAIVIAVAIILISWGVSTLIRLALSRTREYLADAGAVELTKNPEAMIRALEKIEKNALFEVPSRMEAFFIENPVADHMGGLLSTHPPIADRIAALRRFAAARV